MQALGIRLSAVALLCVVASAAQAAPPRVNGSYAFASHSSCEAQLTTNKKPTGELTSVNPAKSGSFGASVGYINFTPTSATAGNATITGATLMEGGAVRVNGSGFAWATKADNQAAHAYSFTATTFIYAGQTYQMVYADPYGAGNAFFRTVYLLRRSNDAGMNCLEVIHATKQALN
jgi:hypothetical protein